MGMLMFGSAIFAGLAVCMAMIYSLAQTIMVDGAQRWLNAACIALVILVMTAATYNAFPIARLLALPLLVTAMVAMWYEQRWYKTFPVLYQIFAAVLLIGVTP